VVVVNKDAYRYGATNSARSGDLRADACAVSHLTCGTKVLIPFLMQPRTETSSQPCQPEHALNTQPRTQSSSQPCQPEHALIMQPRMESSSQPCLEHALIMQPRMESSSQPCLAHALIMQPRTESSSQPQPERAPPIGGKPCATIVPESHSTRDNAIQTIKIETSAGSADVTKQSVSSADSTKTPANEATMEMQTYSYECEAQLMLQEAQLKLQEAINGDPVVCARDSEFKASLNRPSAR